MRARRLTVRNDAFHSGEDGAARRCVYNDVFDLKPTSDARARAPEKRRSSAALHDVAAASNAPCALAFWSAPVLRRFGAAVTLNGCARRPYHRYDSSAAAFSLVEVVLALGVAAFCMIAIVGLMPVGVQTNRHATSQTAATNIMAAVMADLRTTPPAATTSPQFAITFDAGKTLFFDASGQASASLAPDSRYRLNITWNSAPAGLHYAVLKVTWPASVDPATTAPSGSVKIFAAFDRN